MYQNQRKTWVADLVTPYLVCFGVAAAVSLGTLAVKCRLLIQKFRDRHQHARRGDHDAEEASEDANWREQWIAKMEAEQQAYTEPEKLAIAQAVQLLGAFAVASGTSRTKFDAQSRRLVGATTCTIPGARPDQVVAYLMHADGNSARANLDPNVQVRFDVVERANSHQIVIFSEMKTAPFQNRTFLNLCVCRELSSGVWILAAVPLGSHPRISPQSERHALRAEAMRGFRLTPVETDTQIEYCCWLDLKGSFPTWFTNKVAIPQLMTMPFQIQSYFRRLHDAEAADRLEENHLEIRKLYCTILLGLVEDLPMASLSFYYLVKSLDECIGSANAHRTPSTDFVVCDLPVGNANILNLLSVITSAAMLMYKVRPFATQALCGTPALLR